MNSPNKQDFKTDNCMTNNTRNNANPTAPISTDNTAHNTADRTQSNTVIANTKRNNDDENGIESPVNANSTQTNSFALINAEDSANIFRQFTQGKVITKHIFDQVKSEQHDNSLFTCLFNHESHFMQLYQHLGYQLCLNNDGDFYYVQELREESSDEADDNALKVQTILLQLGRYYSETGRDLTQLCTAMFGFNEADIVNLSKDDDSLAMLKAIKIESWPKAIDFIVSRNFAYKTGNSNYFISSAGKAFLFNLVEQYSQFEQG